MKIAYLMQCHKTPQQINLLIELLRDCDIYIHIDKKSGNLAKKITVAPNVFILNDDKRVNVKWGQISQVSATLNLIDEVLNSGRDYDYIYLISGQDMPLKSGERIAKLLSDCGGSAFMEVVDVSTRRYKRLLKRNEVYTAQWSVKKGFFYRVLRNVWYLLTGGRYHTFKLFRRKIDGAKFYFGSQWWCLPFDAVKQMSVYLAENPNYYKFFSHCHCPDESFFQTLLLNFTSYQDKVNPITTFVNWGVDNNSPENFVMADKEKIDGLINSEEYLFARKFDCAVDTQIIEYIKNTII